MSPYLRELRALVGHRLLVLASVAVFVWDERGRLLLVREADTRKWQTIGGAVEPDESPFQAAVREAAEEANVVIEIDGIRGVAGGPRFRLRYANGDLVGYVVTMLDAHVISGEPRPDQDETIEVAWFTPDQLASTDLTEFTVALFEVAGVSRRSAGRAWRRPW
jgi:8-oxo-dGTP pyrophosphatase MutT (NUDIX family)